MINDKIQMTNEFQIHEFNNEVQHLRVLKASALRYVDYAKNLRTSYYT